MHNLLPIPSENNLFSIKENPNSKHLLRVITILVIIITIGVSCKGPYDSTKHKKHYVGLPLPYIKETNGVKHLYVEDKPYIILGGELLNSSASDISYMEPIWPRLKSMNINTVLLPISWQQFEPQEGVFDFSLIDNHIEKARINGLKVVILWFGSWKNGESNYTPDWVKTDLKRFPRMYDNDGEITQVISNIHVECLLADKHAYVKLMERIALVDKHHTVIMMQIENEVGLLGATRDFSPSANELFKQQVPQQLTQYLTTHTETLKPNIREAFENNGMKPEGSWAEIFGQSSQTDEIFMAWYYARYINTLAKAGKKIHNLPVLVNAWAADAKHSPGFWPSGGPNYRMLDIWQAAAPNIDVLAIDNYGEAFDEKCADFIHKGNPLFIPEACAIWMKDTISAGAKAFYTIGHYNAICFSPFGIDHEVYHTNHPIKSAYRTLSNLMPFITAAQAQHRINAFMEYDNSTPTSFELGNYKFTASYGISKASHIKGFGMVIQTTDNEFIIAGNAFQLWYESTDTTKTNAQLISIEEGDFINGEWVRNRVLNGDEFDIKLPAKPYNLKTNVALNEVGILKVKLFLHE